LKKDTIIDLLNLLTKNKVGDFKIDKDQSSSLLYLWLAFTTAFPKCYKSYPLLPATVISALHYQLKNKKCFKLSIFSDLIHLYKSKGTRMFFAGFHDGYLFYRNNLSRFFVIPLFFKGEKEICGQHSPASA